MPSRAKVAPKRNVAEGLMRVDSSPPGKSRAKKRGLCAGVVRMHWACTPGRYGKPFLFTGFEFYERISGGNTEIEKNKTTLVTRADKIQTLRGERGLRWRAGRAAPALGSARRGLLTPPHPRP
jgi:hypothetical protein